MNNKNKKSESKVIPFPNLEKRLLNKGMDALKEKEYKEALQILTQLTASYENYPEVEVGIVICLLELGLYEDAKDKCERLLQEDIGDYFNVLQIYMTILIQLSEYEKVVSILEALFEEERVPSEHAEELFHLLEFSRKSSNQKIEQMNFLEGKESQLSLKNQLKNGNVAEQLDVIRKLGDEPNISPLLEDIEMILADKKAHPIVQSMLLQLMMEKQIDKAFVVQKFGRSKQVNLSELNNIFEEPFTIQVLNKLEDHLGHENPSLFDAMKEVWERYLFVLFPFQPKVQDVMLWSAALHKLGYDLFGIDSLDNEITDLYNVKKEEIEQLCENIMEVEKIAIYNNDV